jgi:hypothetical protein
MRCDLLCLLICPLTIDEGPTGDQTVTCRGSAVIYGGLYGLDPRPLKRVRGVAQGGWGVPLHTTSESRLWASWVVRRTGWAGAV